MTELEFLKSNNKLVFIRIRIRINISETVSFWDMMTTMMMMML